MVKGLWPAGLIVVLCASLQAQSPPATAAFELAGIQPGAPSAITAMRGGAPRDGRYELRGATMVDLIRTAYAVDADKVVGGPHWLELDRFDVVARVPASATRDSVKPMLQALLGSASVWRFVRMSRTSTAMHSCVGRTRSCGNRQAVPLLAVSSSCSRRHQAEHPEHRWS